MPHSICGVSTHTCNFYLLFLQSMAKKKIQWGKKLRKAREKIGYSLAEAVKFLYEEHKLRLDRTQLARIERGESDCAVEKFRALCDIYSVSSDLVLDLKE